MRDSTVFWIHLDYGFAEKIWTLQTIPQIFDFGNLEFAKHFYRNFATVAQSKFWRDLNFSFAKRFQFCEVFCKLQIMEIQEQWKDCKTGSTIWEKPQPRHCWSDQHFENMRLQPQTAKFLVWPPAMKYPDFENVWSFQIWVSISYTFMCLSCCSFSIST